MPASSQAAASRKKEIIAASELPAFQAQMLSWFASAKRDLDWRRTRDPYRVWVSEIMLQQTRVAAVLPYYQRFVARFPTTRALARAPLDAVLRHWAGLGYYSRARNLHRAAKQIVAQHGGEFPRRFGEALALPGIGHYTAAAVLSIAYGEPHAVVDGNVARVLARLGAMRGDLRRLKRWRELNAAAGGLLPAQASSGVGPGDWNQAMMELGATVCTPRAPECAACPVARWCRAYALGLASRLPTARPKPKTVRLALSAAILLDSRGGTLILREKSELGTLFSNLWQFPVVESTKPGPENLARYLQSEFGVKARLEPLPTRRHTVTFRRITLAPFLVRVAKLPVRGAPMTDDLRTLPLAEIECLPISSATRKIAAAARAAIED